MHKVIIIGSGPAGYTAAIYAARANLAPLLFEGFHSGPAGGQLMTTTEVENYPGFPQGITGPELMGLFREQAVRFGTQILTKDVDGVDLRAAPLKVFVKGQIYETSSLILATGATANRLAVEGARDGELWQKGVSACAVCDGAMPIFRDKDLFVIGGGDTAVEEALFLTKYARMVFLVHRRDKLRASSIMAQRLEKHPKIKILWNKQLVKVSGKEVVDQVTVECTLTKKREELAAGGVFFAVGHTPNTAFLGGALSLKGHGYIETANGSTRTSKEGVFACGDVQDPFYRQAVSAAGSGCMAALDAERWLTSKGLS